MVEKIIVNPSEVRGLGDIVSPKSASDFSLYGATLESGTDTVYGVSMGVYLMEPDLGEATSLTVTSSSSTLVLDGTVTISATLKDSSNVAISGATITFKESDTTLGTGTTNSSGVATYTYTGTSVGSHTVVGVYDGDSTYASSTGNVSLTVSDHSYSLAFSQASYTATGGSATLSVTLLDNNVAVSGATVSVTGSDSSLYTGITDSSGIASVTVTNISAETTFTASYSGATATCTVTVQSYLFYDDCSSSSGLSNYGSLVSLESSGTNAGLTYDSTENAYALTSLSSGLKVFPITDLNGKDDFKLSFQFRTPSTTNDYGLGISAILPSSHTGVGMFINKGSGGREVTMHTDVNNSETGWTSVLTISGYDTTKYYKLELTVTNGTATFKLYKYDDTLLKTETKTLSDVSSGFNTVANRGYGLTVGWKNNSSVKMYIKNIVAESL